MTVMGRALIPLRYCFHITVSLTQRPSTPIPTGSVAYHLLPSSRFTLRWGEQLDSLFVRRQLDSLFVWGEQLDPLFVRRQLNSLFVWDLIPNPDIDDPG
ncbi:hypothetical protein BLNAU_17152 [Blattamonas nauphoetae]|uniref:Uncharacterized protein n=1 Tax=Blattamonas nauphoetae TaxID=2049346 RepID=A0ABQ9X9P6_9EUKA|nr:hypothetical protein BLNAU_17152 [Blattamonas nauphoetae]